MIIRLAILLSAATLLHNQTVAQEADSSQVELGSRTAKGGFRNEDEIKEKFNKWKTDKDAQAWLRALNYTVADVVSVVAGKPHGQKADIEVTVTTKTATRVENISIKLVSSSVGFNQIDKRWLKKYAANWKMPPDVVATLKLYVGETPPLKNARKKDRMYLNEFPKPIQEAVVDFFEDNKPEIVSDLLAGDGEHAAGWFMVTFRNAQKPKWLIRSMKDTIRFYSEGDVVLTRYGNLKIGRISMQRKGGDNGRETAKMLQFKINPVQLYDAKN